MIEHHVKEEEQKDGMFDEAQKSEQMNLAELGEQLFARKNELMAIHKSNGTQIGE